MPKVSKAGNLILDYLKTQTEIRTPREIAEALELSYPGVSHILRALTKMKAVKRELTGRGYEFGYSYIKTPTVHNEYLDTQIQPHSATNLRASFKKVGTGEFKKFYEEQDLFGRIATAYMNYDVMITRASSGEKITAEELKQFESELQAVVRRLQTVSLSVQRFLATEQCWDHTRVAKFFLSNGE